MIECRCVWPTHQNDAWPLKVIYCAIKTSVMARKELAAKAACCCCTLPCPDAGRCTKARERFILSISEQMQAQRLNHLPYAPQEEKRQKKKRKAEAKPSTQADSSIAGNNDDDGWNRELHPWRPFDREKDLNMGPKIADKDRLIKQAGNLTSRFGSNSGQRNFL